MKKLKQVLIQYYLYFFIYINIYRTFIYVKRYHFKDIFFRF